MPGRGPMAAVVLVLLLGAACGADEPTRADGGEPAPPTPPPAEVAEMWAIDDPVVAADGPAGLHILGADAPEGTVTLSVRPPDPDDPNLAHASTPPDDGAQTLYADPEAADPATGRAVAVGRVEVSDIEGELILPPGDPVTIAGTEGEVVEVGDLVVVRWPNEVVTGDCACQQDLFVAARGVAGDAVVALARQADATAGQPSLPAAALDGLASLGTAATVQHVESPRRLLAEEMEVTTPEHEISIQLIGTDPRLLPHLRFWAPDAEVLSRYPRTRVATRLADGTVAVASVWPPDDGDDEPGAPVDPAVAATAAEVLAALEPATPAEVAAAQEEILRTVPLAPCETMAPEGQTDITGVVGDSRWTIGVAHRDGMLDTCEEIAGPDDVAAGGGGGSAGARPLDLAAAVEIVGGMTAGDGTGRWRQAVIGHVTTDAARVEVSVGGGPPVDAVLGDGGPAPGRVWFATVLDATGPTTDAPPLAVARAADGTEVGRAEGL